MQFNYYPILGGYMRIKHPYQNKYDKALIILRKYLLIAL